MDQQTLIGIMAAFVVISAIALAIQAGMLFGIYKASRAMQENVSRLMPKIETLMETSRVTLDESRTRIVTITDKANGILDITHTQLERVDKLLADATERTQRQMEHAEAVVEDTLERAHRTVAMVEGGVVKPLREINAISQGIRAALRHLLKSARPNPDSLTVDEEMFI